MKFLRPASLLIAVLAGAVSFGCSTVSPYYDAAKPHHGKEGFVNNYLKTPIADGVLRWNYERLRDGLPKPPANGYAFPVDQPDIAWLAANRSETSVTWIGHATVLVQMGGLNILTDPIFSDRASPFSFLGPERKVRTPLSIAQLPHIDLVLISHNHYDHLDLPTVQALNQQAGGAPQFFVPLGVKPWMVENGITNVVEMDWWNRADVRGLQLHFVPVQHWSARSFHDRFETLWGGWIAQAGGDKPFSMFFAGDTGYSEDFRDIGKKFGGVDLALIPIGAYAPRWFMKPQHVDPGEAGKIHQDVKATQSIGIHWGTFELTDESLDAPPALLKQEAQKAALAEDAFTTLRHGETRRY